MSLPVTITCTELHKIACRKCWMWTVHVGTLTAGTLCHLGRRSQALGLLGFRVNPLALYPNPQVLALELLKVLLENSGPVFHSSEKFTAAIKQYLILSLIRNAGSPFPQACLSVSDMHGRGVGELLCAGAISRANG